MTGVAAAAPNDTRSSSEDLRLRDREARSWPTNTIDNQTQTREKRQKEEDRNRQIKKHAVGLTDMKSEHCIVGMKNDDTIVLDAIKCQIHE